MPYPNEHAVRLRDPGQYERIRRVNDQFGKGIHAIFGFKKGAIGKGKGGGEIQAIRFDAKKYSIEQVREWLKDHKEFKPIKTEKATGGEEKHKDIPTLRITLKR